MTALLSKENVLALDCLYSEVPLQAECSGWFQIAVSLHRKCPYNKSMAKEKPPNALAGAAVMCRKLSGTDLK